MEEKRTLNYFVSDVHLGLDVKDPADREARFVRFLREIPPRRTEALYLLGDIWDFWYEYRDVVPKGYVKVFAALTDLMDAGVKVYFFRGNHDIWSYSYFESLGMIRLEQPCVTEIGGKVFCLGHGDGLGPGMHGYKVMRAAFRNPLLQFLFSMLHPWLAFRLGKGWSRRSRLAKSETYVFRGAEEPLYAWCEEFAAGRRTDYFVFGHFHARTELDLPCGARLMILGDWMTDSPYFLFDGEVLTAFTSGMGASLPKIEK